MLLRAHYLRQRRKRLAIFGGALFLVLGAVTAWNLLDLHLPVPPPTSNLSPSVALGDWPMSGLDPQRTGYLIGDAPPTQGQVVWQEKVAESMAAPPVLERGILYLGTQDSRVLALDSRTGEVVWERTVERPVDLSLTVAGGFLYVPLRNGRLLAVDKGTGEPRWSFFHGDTFLASPLVYNGSVYLSTRDRKLYSLDAATGDERWVYRLRVYSLSPPATADNILVVGTEDGNLHLLDIRNGTMRRLYPGGFPVHSPAVVLEGKVFSATTQGHVRAISFYTREIPFEQAMRAWWWQFFIWRMLPAPPQPRGALWLFTRQGESFAGGLAAAHNRLFLGSSKGDKEGRVYALAQETGQMAWEFDPGGPVSNAPTVVGETVYIASDTGVLYGLEAATGDELLRLDFGAIPVGSPVFGAGTLFVATTEGTLYAFR